MKKIDEKVISILLSFVFLFTIFCPAIVYADGEIPEDAIEFQSERLKNALINEGIDTNNDGYITISEMEAYEGGFNLSNYDSMEEIKYAKNIKSLYIYRSNIDNVDFSNFKKLKSFSYWTNNDLLSNEEIQKFVTELDYLYLYQGNDEALFGRKLPEEISIFEKEAEEITDIPGIGGVVNVIDDEIAEVSKFDIVEISFRVKAIGLKEGTTRIVCDSGISTKEIEVSVTKSTLYPNQPLNDTNITATFIKDSILQSNGDLWKIKNSGDNINAEKIATNIKDYSYVYSRGDKKSYRIFLDNNNLLKIKKIESDNPGETEIMSIQNVKEIYHRKHYYGNVFGYIDENNDFYFMNLFLNDYEPQLLLSNVEEVKGAYIIAEGKTYKLKAEAIVKVSDSVIDKQNGSFYSIGNNLYSEEGELLATDFSDFCNESYYTVDGKIKSLGLSTKLPFGTETNIVKYNEVGYYLTSDKELYKDENLIVLNGVTDFINGSYYGLEDYNFMTRTDGTVWARKRSGSTDCFKLIDTERNEIIKGDINQDGAITLSDAFTILKNVVFGSILNAEETLIMDFNNDGRVTLYDAFCFLKIIILS